MVDAFGGNRVKVKPPERGVFPLDHEGECRPFAQEFLKCLKDNNQDHFPCKDASKAYLSCRMEHGLMAVEELSNLGFDKKRVYKRKQLDPNESKESAGFVAGTGVKGSSKCFFFCK